MTSVSFHDSVSLGSRPTYTEGGPPSRRRFQIRLKDLMVWVLGTAIVLEFVRRWWMTWFAAGNFRRESLIILATLILEAGLGLRLAGQVIGLARRRWEPVLSGLSLSRASRVAAIVWRLLALVLLCACVVEAARLFAFSADRASGIGGDPGQWELRWNILPFCGLYVLGGLLLGMKPPAARDPGRVRPRWLSGLLSIVLGVGLLAGLMDLPYLILISLEGLSIAQIHPFWARPAPDLTTRIYQAGVPAALALVATLATGAWIAYDLRRAASEPAKQAMSVRGLVYRLSTFVAMVAFAVYLVRTTIPGIHDCVWLGMRMILGPVEVTAIAVGFAVLYAGVAARAIGRSGDVLEPGRRKPVDLWMRLGQVVSGGTVLVLNSTWIARLLKRSGCLRALPLGDLADLLIRAVTYWDTLWFEEWITYWSYAMWCPLLAWAALETLRLCGPEAPDRMTSFDAVATSRADAGRFLGLGTALAVLVLCTLPALFVAALVVHQTRLMCLG
jgi:hypothetical protein